MRLFVEQWVSRFASSTLGAAVVLMVVQIVLRFGFNSPQAWAEEVDRYLFVWAVYLGSAIALAKGSHIRVTFIVDLGAPKFQNISQAINKIVNFVSFSYVGYYGYKLAYANLNARFYTVEFMPLVLFYLAVPIGMTLMVIHLIMSIKRKASFTK